ncbi:ABC transporter permease [Gelidibacter salicanalis]|uniref:ABC transporter permease n=1 Tax=Gelidibacter salicanalis TaxID=291193 RepID=A0A934NBG8_9FLAO|nr:ABC transporter permease [Gelidibacter salicanalis]MBJ7879615.1 ABC transporter permease [Gelidibacter salicanalis]
MNIAYHLKTVYRNFISQRPYSFLNLIGLIIGLCISFIALLYVTEETGYDTFHENSKDIYRLLTKEINSDEIASPNTTAHIGKELQEEIPEIKNVIRYKNAFFRINGLIEARGIYADPELFNVFTFNITAGNIESFKDDVFVIVISEEFALREFGAIDVVGKSIELEKEEKIKYTIRAVYKEFPKKSTLKPSYILPIKSQIKEKVPGVEISSFNTYFLLEKNSNHNDTAAKVLKKGYKLQSLEDIHLHSDGSIKVLLSYALIGVLILLISLLNFLLLYTAITQRRFKEFAIRKVNGLSELGLLKMFMVESIIISLIAATLAIILVGLVLPFFNSFTKSNIEFSWFSNAPFFIYAIGLVIVVALLSGYKLYHYLNKYNAIEFIGKTKTSKKTNFFLKSNGLALQLIIVSFMLIFSLGYYKQLDFILTSDKGYNPKHVFVIGGLAINSEIFKEEAKKHPEISDVAMGQPIPDPTGSSITRIHNIDSPSELVEMELFSVDYNYIPLYGITITEGRNFSNEFITDKMDAIILNETAVKLLNLEKPIGIKTNMGTIIGVVKDFNFEALHKSIRPSIFKVVTENNSSKMIIGYKPEDKENTIAIIETLLGNQNVQLANILNPTYSDPEMINIFGSMEEARKQIFDPNYMDSVNEMFYEKEKTLQKTILLLTIIAMFITILGLIGMSLFKTQQKTKEIGIRKVNGATITEIMLMLNKDFIKWVVIAFVIACPIAYYAMRKWLENFAYKTSLSWWVFALAGVFTLVIALVTVSWQTYRAATRNPVESLRDE